MWAALELLGFGNMVKQLMGLCGDFFPPACDFLLAHCAMERFYLMCLNLLGFLPIYPFMVIKMTFL